MAGVIYGISRHFTKQEVQLAELVKNKEIKTYVIIGAPTCDRVFICPHADDLSEVKKSLFEVQQNVAKLSGTLAGVANTVEFIGKNLQRFNSGGN